MFKKTVQHLQPFRWFFILFIAVLVIVLSLNAHRVGAAGSSYYSILAETMRPLDTSIGFNNYSAYLVTTADSTWGGTTAYIGQVHLPDGAVISGVHVYGVDLDASKNFSACMYRYNQNTNPVYGVVANCASSSGSPGKTTLNLPVPSVAAATIDNLTYSYTVYVLLPRATVLNINVPNLAVLRTVIEWSYPAYMPLILK